MGCPQDARRSTAFFFCLTLFGCNAASEPPSTAESTNSVEARTAVAMQKERARLDDTVWAKEVRAQQFEEVIVRFWDRIRASTDGLEELARFPLAAIHVGTPDSTTEIDLKIDHIQV